MLADDLSRQTGLGVAAVLKLRQQAFAQVDGAPQVTIAYVEEVLDVPDGASDACDAEDRDLEFTSQGREAGELVFVLGEDGRFRAKQ